MRYDAFISYRHSELDMYVARKLHKGLETFRVPRGVAVKSGKKNIKRVFRDQEELPIGSDLSDNITSALEDSEFLLVICSPRTPESYWVKKEIETFIGMHGRDRVLAILIEGEPNQSFPKMLLEDEYGNAVEPLAADVRGKSKSEIDKKLKSELLRLAAPLLYCTYDDLKQRHRERRMKKMAVAFGGVAALGIAFGVYNAYNAVLIQQNLEGKQRNQSKYLADTALNLLEAGDRRAAALVAMEALPSERNDRPYVAEAQYALSRSLHCYDTGNTISLDRSLRHELPVQQFWMNDEGNRIVAIDQGGNTYLWDTENGEKMTQVAPRVNEMGYVIKVINAILFDDKIVISDSESVYATDFNGNELWKVDAKSNYCEFHLEKGIAVCVYGDVVAFVDIFDGKLWGTMDNQVEGGYSSGIAFDEDESRVAVSHYMGKEATQGCVSVYNFETKKITDIRTKPVYIADMDFDTTGNLVVAGNMFGSTDEELFNPTVGYVERIDVATQTSLWSTEHDYQNSMLESAGTQIKCRKYLDDETGGEHEEILVAVDNKVYTWDTETGELLAQVGVSNAISSFLVSVNNSFGYLADGAGIINIVDMSTGKIYPDSAIETGKSIRDMQIQNGVLAMRAYASPDITMMRYQEGAGMECLNEFSSSVDSVCYSTDESYYAVTLSSQDYYNEVYFYKTADNSDAGSWIDAEGGYTAADFFTDEDTYVAIRMDGTIFFCDIVSGKQQVMKISDEFNNIECSINEQKNIAFLWDGSMYCVVDLLERKVIDEGTVEDYFMGGIISEDGSWAYCNVQEVGVCKLDIKTGELICIDLNGHFVISNIDSQDALALSSDGAMLAVACEDGILRILETVEMNLIAEIPYAVQYRSFLQFSSDNTEILMQGDDYYLRVYNLKENRFSYISTEQYNKISHMIIDKKSETISLVTSAEMIILNSSDYERIAVVESGEAYLPQYGRVLSSYYHSVYQFPFMTLEMLYEEAEQQFGEDSLSEFERIQYHVE